MEQVHKKIHIRKWIYLTLSLLVNAFIMTQAALPASLSARWSNIFVRFFTNLFNGSGKDTTEVIDVSSIALYYDSTYQYNDILGYKDDELVIGKTKRLAAEILPNNATNRAVKFTSDDNSLVKITQNENYAYVSGLKEGKVTIKAVSLENNSFIDSYTFNIVNPIAPLLYTLKDITVYQDSLFYLPVMVDNESYYDLTKLEVINDNPSILTKSIDYEGLYYASSIGKDHLVIGEKEVFITVKDRGDIVLPHFTSIEGKEIINTSSSASYKVIYDNNPTIDDVYWEVSNSEIASISKEGVLSIKDIKEESKVVITAKSLLDPSISISKEVTIKPVTITSFELVIPYYGTHITNMPYMGETGEEIRIWMEDNTGTIGISGVTVSSSNEEVAKVYAQGSYIYINCIKDGDTRIIVTSINNPEVSKYIDLQVVIRGVINHDNYLSFSEFIRKSIGHFLLFLVNGVFTFLFLYELDKDITSKYIKRWHVIVLALLIGLFFAGLSEFIQFLVPTRYGSMIDVLVDFGGYALGVVITIAVIQLIYRYKTKKRAK